MADLKQYFPMIQERKEVLKKIRESRQLLTMALLFCIYLHIHLLKISPTWRHRTKDTL